MACWLCSLHPQHWEAVASGAKRYELRRRLPGIVSGDLLYVYVTLPVGKVLGALRVEEIVKVHTFDELWEHVQGGVPMEEAVARAYFRGSPRAEAIKIGDVEVLTHPRTLTCRPPQSFCRVVEGATFAKRV